MVITESLANGLKNRFISELSDEIDRRFNSLYKETRNIRNSRNGWIKLAQKTKQNFDRCSIAFYQGGTKRKPYFGFYGLVVDKNRPYNNWSEKCVYGFPVISSYDPRITEPSICLFNISEHSIARIFERGSVKVTNDTEIDVFSILPEFHMLPLWANYWARIIADLVIGSENLDIRPVIPTKSGLFFAQINYDQVPYIEIRTFVDDSRLSEQQKQVKEVFLKATKGVESSPLLFYPANQYFGVDDVTPQLDIMSRRIYKYSELIGKVFFHHIDDDKFRNSSIEMLNKVLKDFASRTTDEISNVYHDSNISLYQSIYLKINREKAFRK